ncbi:hypothetical protein C8A05DRAFT_19247 [Staphylotrichum tortipilum]|uniref:Rhodopsin domain-containing protein n=1 Tax=Staphylotrichum tortipilum TaxID=2831512 RepID=A0AAN6RPE6_9PEZI|nr:hypothetical protein C8A05DRAFT_19247 [Staphylotrichum longicolle]
MTAILLRPRVTTPNDDGDATIFGQTNVAIWVLTGASGAFLAVRIWCRYAFSKLFWDDALLVLSWVILVVSAGLISAASAAGYATDQQKLKFFLYQNTGVAMTTLATAWSKVAFAITLYRIIRNRYLKYFLWFVMLTANLILIPGMMSIWLPACADPRKVFRPAYPNCMDHVKLQYLGGTTIVYGGVIDVLLALFPFFIIRKLLLDTREKLGLTFAMSMGIVTGAIVIFRAFFQLKKTDNNYHFMIFMAIFNFLEPAVTIIAQAIPMFRVLIVNVKKATSAVRISSPTMGNKSNMHSQQLRSWNAKVMGGSRVQPDEELLHVKVDTDLRVVTMSATAASGTGSATSARSDSWEDKIYDGSVRR